MGAALLGTPVGASEPASAPDGSHSRCACPATLTALGGALPHPLAEVRVHRSRSLVALEPSSAYGTGASGEAATYPSRLAVERGQMLPGVRIEVVNKGVPGEIAGDMMARLE